jgi:hypothetical protein
MSVARQRTRNSDVEASPAVTAVGSSPQPVYNEKAGGVRRSSSGHDRDATHVDGHDGRARASGEHHSLNFHLPDGREFEHAIEEDVEIVRKFWRRFRGVDRWVSWGTSFKNIVMASRTSLCSP